MSPVTFPIGSFSMQQSFSLPLDFDKGRYFLSTENGTRPFLGDLVPPRPLTVLDTL